MEDRQIIDLYFDRSEEAVAQTERKYGAYCGAVAANILPAPEDVEECLSDTWLAAWQSIPPAVPACLRVFLGRITRNLAIDRWRSRRAARRGGGIEVLLSELEDCLPDPQGVETALERRELSAVLASWLDALPAEERRLFVRRYWYGVPVRTLAAEAELRPNLISQRLLRLRQKLKNRLEQEEIAL